MGFACDGDDDGVEEQDDGDDARDVHGEDGDDDETQQMTNYCRRDDATPMMLKEAVAEV